MTLSLDTNAYTALMKGDASAARQVRGAEAVMVSAVVAGELLYGFRNGKQYDRNRRQLDAFLAEAYVEFRPVTWLTCERFALVAAQLRRAGTPLPTNDIWVAAHALETGAHLLSYDAHFGKVAGLIVIHP